MYQNQENSPDDSGSYDGEGEEESEMSFGENIDKKIDKIKQNIRDDSTNKEDSINKLNEVL